MYFDSYKEQWKIAFYNLQKMTLCLTINKYFDIYNKDCGSFAKGDIVFNH